MGTVLRAVMWAPDTINPIMILVMHYKQHIQLCSMSDLSDPDSN